MHLDHLVGVPHSDAGRGGAMHGQSRTHLCIIPNQHHGQAMITYGSHGPGDYLTRRMIAAHRIQRDWQCWAYHGNHIT